MLRRHGEMERLQGEPVLTNEKLEAMRDSIMPDRNREEFARCTDTVRVLVKKIDEIGDASRPTG